MKYTVIGISDSPTPFFPPEVTNMLRSGRIFSGGRRHHDIVRHLLPEDAVWIDITVPLSAVFDQYRQADGDIIVFASGDPLFFGFANTLKKTFPEAEITVHPTFNSLQLLAHRLVMPYHDMHIVSLTGRDWPAFDEALITGTQKIGVLTDKTHTPAAIAQRMLDYGYTDYKMYVGEHLGNPLEEQVSTLSLEEAARLTFALPNCLILTGHHPRRYGIPDEEFCLLNGREKMITKMPIRLLTLQRLDLYEKRVFWDIGFCTGSVSVEARLQFPHLHIEAFEIREEGKVLMETNTRRFGAPGISIHIGDFLETDLSALPRPDAVFIGGHGGHLKEIMRKVTEVLTDNGCIVMNSVTSANMEQATHRISSKDLFEQACKELDLRAETPLRIKLNDYNTIEILKCKKQPSYQ